jgi:hypothetical protein
MVMEKIAPKPSVTLKRWSRAFQKPEAAADEFSKALKNAIEKVNEVYKYYDQEDYKDDNFKLGKGVACRADPGVQKL